LFIVVIFIIAGPRGLDPQPLSKIFRKLKFYKVLLVAARKKSTGLFTITVRVLLGL